MTEVATGESTLNWDVLVTPGIPSIASDPGSAYETADVVADIVDTYLWQAGRRPRRPPLLPSSKRTSS